jgi:hypothetical protein
LGLSPTLVNKRRSKNYFFAEKKSQWIYLKLYATIFIFYFSFFFLPQTVMLAAGLSATLSRGGGLRSEGAVDKQVSTLF